jgi:hypothetical protein
MVTVDQEASMTTQECIRQIFLKPRDAYTIEETATLLRYSNAEILVAISRGDLAVEAAGEIPRIEWEELALAAVERWPQEVIEDALGTDSPSVVPELVRLTELRVRVPRYGVIVLGRLVACKGSFGTSDAVFNVDVAPTNRTWLVVVTSDVGHQLAA